MAEESNHAHDNTREEQFWFTAAAVGANALALQLATAPTYLRTMQLVLSGLSLFTCFLILNRWAAHANRRPSGEPDYKTAKWHERLGYTCKEIPAAFACLPYVATELSGSFFYLVLIGSVNCLVWIRNW
jgi:hypothetical protein